VVPWNELTGMRAIAATLLLAVALSTTGVMDGLAQGTPTALPGDVPSPEECLVESRELPLLPEGAGQSTAATPGPIVTGTPQPFALPTGEPADAEITAAVMATVREAVACRNAGDLLRAYSLFTQEMLVALFGGPETIDPEVRAVVAEGPRPLQPERRLGIVGMSEVVILPDGRAGALVETATTRREFLDYLYFERDPESGRWLIDQAMPLRRG
jgi:hypothetical protein